MSWCLIVVLRVCKACEGWVGVEIVLLEENAGGWSVGLLVRRCLSGSKPATLILGKIKWGN